jgi:hypothetical protein
VILSPRSIIRPIQKEKWWAYTSHDPLYHYLPTGRLVFSLVNTSSAWSSTKFMNSSKPYCKRKVRPLRHHMPSCHPMLFLHLQWFVLRFSYPTFQTTRFVLVISIAWRQQRLVTSKGKMASVFVIVPTFCKYLKIRFYKGKRRNVSASSQCHCY